MQRHDDPAFGQGAPHDMRKLRAQKQEMMQMDDVWPEIAQEFDNVRNNAIEIDLAHEEAVEMPGPQQDFIAVGADALEARSRSCLTMDVIGCAEKKRFASGPLIGAEKVMGEYFRATWVQGWMIVCSDKYTGHRPPLCSSATNRS